MKMRILKKKGQLLGGLLLLFIMMLFSCIPAKAQIGTVNTPSSGQYTFRCFGPGKIILVTDWFDGDDVSGYVGLSTNINTSTKKEEVYIRPATGVEWFSITAAYNPGHNEISENPCEIFILDSKGIEDSGYMFGISNVDKSKKLNVRLEPMRKPETTLTAPAYVSGYTTQATANLPLAATDNFTDTQLETTSGEVVGSPNGTNLIFTPPATQTAPGVVTAYQNSLYTEMIQYNGELCYLVGLSN